MFTHILKSMMLTSAARAALVLPERKAKEEQPARPRKRKVKRVPFCHYLRIDSAVGQVTGRTRNGRPLYRRTHTALHATKGRRTFKHGFPAPLGIAPRPPGKIDRLDHARAQGRAR